MPLKLECEYTRMYQVNAFALHAVKSAVKRNPNQDFKPAKLAQMHDLPEGEQPCQSLLERRLLHASSLFFEGLLT